MTKEQVYNQLVTARKECRLCSELKLTNQSQAEYDTSSIGKWSDWQGNLNANIMVIGQDWGSLTYWNENRGTDSPNNPTNLNLIRLFDTLGCKIGTIHKPTIDQPLFFTNSVLCLKQGNMSAKLTQKCIQNCGSRFLKPLVDLINPGLIITIGYKPYASLLALYKPNGWEKIKPLKAVVRQAPIILNPEGLKLIPMYHCGGLGLANRRMEEQLKDWKDINKWL